MITEYKSADQLFEQYKSLTKNWADDYKTRICKLILDSDNSTQPLFHEHLSHFYSSVPYLGYRFNDGNLVRSPCLFKKSNVELSDDWKKVVEAVNPEVKTIKDNVVPNSLERMLGIYQLPFLIFGTDYTLDPKNLPYTMKSKSP